MTTVSTTSAASAPARSAAEPSSGFSLAIHRYSHFQQIVDFRLAGVALLGVDERPPLGRGWGPSPAHLLGSALGACLGDTLLIVMHAAGTDVLDLRTDVSGEIRCDTLGRPHVMSITVRLTPVLASRADLDAVPTPEALAQRSMIADALRSDLGLWIAITPEVRSGVRPPTYGLSRAGASFADVASPVPRYVEAGARAM
jgi:organic hydroperoxide reductase OsmC/OhrA